ncbi:glutamyl-tRNA reductase [Natronomonas sp. F2-12]|uniref:Glutamyl-tRNA reductase n=1 Tax=Natronomonas aquatica TaxID=2841590 RepID=A0A9R1D632_9EURY|nr:glutamyl-tRNA reductase [Natronomonas aquatica]
MKTGTDILAGVSVSHSDASVEAIERAAVDSQHAAIEDLLDLPSVSEALVLQTCNRAEAYVVTETPEAGKEALAAYLGDVDPAVVRTLDHEESIRHLMAVACGLESLVVGEDQIIGQLRDAYEDARGVGAMGPVLDDAVLKALHVGERARDETAINEGVVSLGSAAVRFLESKRDLEEAAALVVGAGEMARLAAEALDRAVDRILVANRTLSHAEHLTEQLESNAEAVGLDAVATAADEADVVVSATGSSGHVVDVGDFKDAGRTHVVDIARPRDVPPAADGIEGVSVYDLDAIEAITDETRRKREAAAETVEAMIDEEFDHLMAQYKRKRADQVIGAMYEGAERIKARELRTALSKLENEGGVSEAEREILESMADALVGQLLSAPTESLREAAENDEWSTIRTALELFGPAFELEPAEPPAEPDRPGSIPEEMRDRMPAHVIDQLRTEDE